jgi:hypothetical protein
MTSMTQLTKIIVILASILPVLTFGSLIENSSFASKRDWRVGGKIYFEHESGLDYIGITEINNITKSILKTLIPIESDSCDSRSKILIKNHNNKITMTHYEEKNRLGMGEETHATLLYTKPRGFCNSETLTQICSSLFKNCDSPPSIQELAKIYSTILKPEWKFKITQVALTKSSANSSCIIAKLELDGHENIYRDNKPISAGLHVTLANFADDAILKKDGIGDRFIKNLNERLKNSED